MNTVMNIHKDKGEAAKASSVSLALLAWVLSGCASLSPDGGAEAVSALMQERTGQTVVFQRTPKDAEATQARVDELLLQPLTAERAAEIALLNNRGLQASFAALGVAEADRVRAGRVANPSLAFSRSQGGGVTEIEGGVMFPLLSLLTLPINNQVAQAQLEQAQYQAAFDAVGVAAEARKAFFNAVAAQELVAYREQVKQAADASSELAQRMLKAGNFNKLAQLREQSFQQDATANLARARHQAVVERERLVRLLGLSGESQGLALPERLPALPSQPLEPKTTEQMALAQRLDVLMARRQLEATARSLGLTKATRFINVLEVGPTSKSQSGEPRQHGYEIELELPLFDFGAARVARAEAAYMQRAHQLAEVAVNANSEVRESYSAYRTAYELAQHYRDDVVPLRKRMSEENLLRYNGMFVSVFDLLADAREQITSVTGAVEALRDHWIAQVNLQSVLTGRSPGAVLLLNPGPPAAAEQGAH